MLWVETQLILKALEIKFNRQFKIYVKVKEVPMIEASLPSLRKLVQLNNRFRELEVKLNQSSREELNVVLSFRAKTRKKEDPRVGTANEDNG